MTNETDKPNDAMTHEAAMAIVYKMEDEPPFHDWADIYNLLERGKADAAFKDKVMSGTNNYKTGIAACVAREAEAIKNWREEDHMFYGELIGLLELASLDAAKVRELEAQIIHQEEFLKICTDTMDLQKEQLSRLTPRRFSEESPPDDETKVVVMYEDGSMGDFTGHMAIMNQRTIAYSAYSWFYPPPLPQKEGKAHA